MRTEGSREGPHFLKSSGGESINERQKVIFLQVKNLLAHLWSALILTLCAERVVCGCVAQLQLHNARLHHNVIAGVEVT